MSAGMLALVFVLATVSQCLACLFMDRLARRREQWSRRQWLRFELSAEVRRLSDERSRRDAKNAAEESVSALGGHMTKAQQVADALREAGERS